MVGKLVVYIVVVGIYFYCVFLVIFDVGIDNMECFNDDGYFGVCYFCVCGECYDEFVQ